MLTMLIAYDAAGNVVQTNDYMVARSPDGRVVGLLDFEAHELAGGKLRDIWSPPNAVGSGTWPEWIGAAAHSFKVELTGKRITALVHKTSGHRRERASIDRAIAEVLPDERGRRDLRSLLGGPHRHLVLDDEGKTAARPREGTPPHLPLVASSVNPEGRNRQVPQEL